MRWKIVSKASCWEVQLARRKLEVHGRLGFRCSAFLFSLLCRALQAGFMPSRSKEFVTLLHAIVYIQFLVCNSLPTKPAN